MKKILLPIAAIIGTTAIFNSALARDYETEARDLGDFNKIVLNGSADVNIVVGETQSVEVRTESDYMSRVKTEVRGNTLYISQEGRHWRNVDVMLDVRVENLNGIIIDGSGDFDVTNLDSENFEIAINGSGDVNVSGNSISYDVEIDGSGDVTLSGDCNSMVVDVDGSGDVDAENLKCKTVDLTLEGSGDIDAYVSDSLVLTMQGSGDVTIYGDPVLKHPRMKGSGDLRIIEEK